MKKIVLITLLFFTSCQLYVTERKDVTLSGKYVVSKLEISSVDQNQTKDESYLLGSTYRNPKLPDPFNVISINNFYIHFDYSTVRMKLVGVLPSGQDIWFYGSEPNYIFYKNFGGTPFHAGYVQYHYKTKDGNYMSVTFLIEDDGLETLQLRSSGAWFTGKSGEKQVMTISLTRVGP
jgi:hypothetical protein